MTALDPRGLEAAARVIAHQNSEILGHDTWGELEDEQRDCLLSEAAEIITAYLAAHDRAVKAEALREAAEDFTSPIDPTCYLTTEGRKFIRARADQIEGAAE